MGGVYLSKLIFVLAGGSENLLRMLEEEKRTVVSQRGPKAGSKLHPTINHLYAKPACLQSLKMLYRAHIRE